MTKSINIVDLIHAAYYQLSAAERKVADYVLVQTDEIQYMSISQVAEECGVADATVSRFCRSLGLNGFHNFKLEIAKHSATASSGQQPTVKRRGKRTRSQLIAQESVDAINQTIQQIQDNALAHALALIEKASTVLCIGSGGSMITALECAHLFSMVTTSFLPVVDSHMQLSAAATLPADGVILLFSYSGATKNGISILELAKSRKISTILVTRYPKSPAAELANVVLCCVSKESPFQFGSVPSRVAQLVLIDILFQEYMRKNQKQCSKNLQNIALALSEKHL